MQKLFYLLFDAAETSGDALREGLLGSAVPALRDAGAREITIYANDKAVEAGLHTVRRSDPPIRAMVSFWLEDAAVDRVPFEAPLAACVSGLAGYLVVESRPLVADRPAGERAPGMTQVTCIARREELSPEEFARIWHTDHRDVAIETQSSVGYVRNEIFRPLTKDAPMAWAAIVEETFPMEALTDPKVFYNNVKTDEELQRNVKRMMDSCNRFLDPGPMEVTYFSEYYMG